MLNSIYSIQFYLESEDSIAIDFHQHFSFQCDFFKVIYKWNSGFPDGSGVKYLPATAGDAGLIPGSWRSPGTGMATHSSIHVWRIPWTEGPGGLQSVGLQRAGHDWAINTHSVYRLNKQGDNIWSCCTPFPLVNQSVVPCKVLTIVFWHAYRFLRRQVRWSGIPMSWRIFHSLLWFTQSKPFM